MLNWELVGCGHRGCCFSNLISEDPKHLISCRNCKLNCKLVLTSYFFHLQEWLMVLEEQEDEPVGGLVMLLLSQNQSVVLEMFPHQLRQLANLWLLQQPKLLFLEFLKQ